MNILRGLTVCLLLTVIFACQSRSTNPPSLDPDTKIAKMAITGAQSLFIAPTSSLSKSKAEGDINKLFKITPEGAVQQVTYEDKDGNQILIEDNYPRGIYNLNDEFVIIAFDYDSYLVNKVTGVTYQINSEPYIESPQGKVLSDDNGNFYFIGDRKEGTRTVYKLTGLDTTPSIVDYLPTGDTTHEFIVDKAGNLFYYNYEDEYNRIKLLNGSLQNFTPLNNYFWRAVDGNVYFMLEIDNVDTDTGHCNQIKKVVISNDFKVDLQDYGECNLESQIFSGSEFNFADAQKTFIFSGSDKKIFEVYDNESLPRVINLEDDYDKIDLFAQSKSNYFIVGTPIKSTNQVLRKCTLNHSCTDLLTGGYSFYRVFPSDDNHITFSALRMSDGKKVLAKININTKEVEILDESLNAEVRVLERIN